MTLDCSKYEASRKTVENLFLSKFKDDPKRAVGMIASITFVPCIVVAYYIGPLCDWHPDLQASMKSLIDFYGYTEIENKPEGAPF